MPKAETITSAQNPLLKEIRRAIARGGLTGQGLWIAETFHLLDEALRSGCAIRTLLAAEEAAGEVEERAAGVKLVVLPDALFAQISATETAQGVMALVEPPVWSLDRVFGGQSLVLVLDGVQDPGNAGTMVRAAEAFGASGVVFVKGSVSPFHPKTLRASAGSLFRVPFVAGMEASLVPEEAHNRRVRLFAAVPEGGDTNADFTAPCGLVIGSEAHGVGDVLRAVSHEVSIPTTGVESLNAAMAASILLYEARRQRAGRA